MASVEKENPGIRQDTELVQRIQRNLPLGFQPICIDDNGLLTLSAARPEDESFIHICVFDMDYEPDLREQQAWLNLRNALLEKGHTFILAYCADKTEQSNFVYKHVIPCKQYEFFGYPSYNGNNSIIRGIQKIIWLNEEQSFINLGYNYFVMQEHDSQCTVCGKSHSLLSGICHMNIFHPPTPPSTNEDFISLSSLPDSFYFSLRSLSIARKGMILGMNGNGMRYIQCPSCGSMFSEQELPYVSKDQSLPDESIHRMWCNECDIQALVQPGTKIYPLHREILCLTDTPRIYREISKLYPELEICSDSFPEVCSIATMNFSHEETLISILQPDVLITEGHKHTLYNFITHGYYSNRNCIIFYNRSNESHLRFASKINFPYPKTILLPYDDDPWENMGDMIISALQLSYYGLQCGLNNVKFFMRYPIPGKRNNPVIGAEILVNINKKSRSTPKTLFVASSSFTRHIRQTLEINGFNVEKTENLPNGSRRKSFNLNIYFSAQEVEMAMIHLKKERTRIGWLKDY